MKFLATGIFAAACGTRHVPAQAGTGVPVTARAPTETRNAKPREPKLDACEAKVTLISNVNVAGVACDRIVWRDGACRERSAALARVGAGYLRRYTYDLGGRTRVATGTGASGFQGFGYAVSHFKGTGSTSKDRPGTFGPIVVGAHHLVYEYRFTQAVAGQDVPVTMHWMFASGRDHPLVAVTYDASALAPGTLNADIRTPYGDIAWTGDDQQGRAIISGVGWGDRYKFLTTTEPLTMNSHWDYTRPNLVPYAFEWAKRADAEMGLVQTQTYLQHDAGGYWQYVNWGKTSENQQRVKGQVGLMPISWNWTYQLNQYQLCEDDPRCADTPTTAQRLAWGTNFGALGGAKGSATYPAYGEDKQLRGHPYQSYSVFVVFGKHSESPVARQVQHVEELQRVKLEAESGEIATHGPGGIQRTDSVQLEPRGYDARYSVWRIAATPNGTRFRFSVAANALDNPVFVITNWQKTDAPQVLVDGQPLGSALVSHIPAAKELWLTLRGKWSGAHEFDLR